MSKLEDRDDEVAFTSPLPYLIKLKHFIFGENEPDLINKISIYINLVIWFIFQTWHILSYYAINYRQVILEEKKINVEIMIFNRGAELGFDPSVFLNRLINFHTIAILCWILIFVGIALMWRNSSKFAVFTFAPSVIYLLSMFFLLGIEYYLNDTTFFDKILFTLFILNTIFYLIIQKNQLKGTEQDFFIN